MHHRGEGRVTAGGQGSRERGEREREKVSSDRERRCEGQKEEEIETGEGEKGDEGHALAFASGWSTIGPATP